MKLLLTYSAGMGDENCQFDHELNAVMDLLFWLNGFSCLIFKCIFVLFV